MNVIDLGRDTSGRPLMVDDRTLAKLRLAEKRLGHNFTIVQGSYRAGLGAVASAGTHDKGGVIDLRTWNLPPDITPQEAVRQLRLAGLIAWYRTTAQGFDPHIHAIDYGNPDLSDDAADQVAAWENKRNGLANGGTDDGAPVPIPKEPPPPEPTAEERKAARQKINAITEKTARVADWMRRQRIPGAGRLEKALSDHAAAKRKTHRQKD